MKRNLATVKRFECLHLAHSKHSVSLPTNSVGTIIAKETNLTLRFRVRVRLVFMHVWGSCMFRMFRMFRILWILSVFIFCYHIYRYGEGGAHSNSAQCSGEQITQGNTKRSDTGAQARKLVEVKQKVHLAQSLPCERKLNLLGCLK